MYEISNGTGQYCLECSRELGYLDPSIKSFYKGGSIQTQSTFSDRLHPKFNKKRVRCFDCAVAKFGNLSFRPNVHHSDYAGYLFDVPVDKSKVGVTLENMIKRHGEVEGRKRFDEYRAKQAYSNTLEYKRQKHGWSEQQFFEYNKSRATTLENMIKRHGEAEGRKRFDEYRSRQAYTNTIDYFIEKYGYAEGKQKYDEVCAKKKITLENMIRVHGEVEGTERYRQLLDKRSSNLYFSKISQELFWLIDYPGCYFGEKNYEIGINAGADYYVYDFTVPNRKKIIEFNGDYWHANPQIYESHWIHPVSGKSACEIWSRDSSKIDFARRMGYDVLIVWESTYVADKNRVVRKCKEFLQNES